MISEPTATEKVLCSDCGKTVELHSLGMPVDEDTIVCETCYRIMIAPEHKPCMMEVFD